jgi:hypothetical protein
MCAFTVPNIVGTIVLATVAPSSRTQGGLIVAFYCMQVFQSVSRARGARDALLIAAVQPCHLPHARAQRLGAEQKVHRLCHDV